jgi:hypothetical protein
MNEQAKRSAQANGLHYGEHYVRSHKVAGYLLDDERACFEKAVAHAGVATKLIQWFRNGWEQALIENGVHFNAA